MSAQVSQILDNYASHCSGSRTDTTIFLPNLIKREYPNHFVTAVKKYDVDLIGYCKTGEAEATSFPGATFNAIWCTAEQTLENEYQFVCYQYRWKDRKYTVYYAAWKEQYTYLRMFYIVSPDQTKEQQCTHTNRLIKAVGEWTSKPHNEILVYDDGQWEKSRNLWECVCNSSWDQVHLDPGFKERLQNDVVGFFSKQDIYAKLTIPWKRGIIFHGVPGNGKSLTIKALMKTVSGLQGEEILCLYVKSLASNPSVSEQQSMRRVFQRARAAAPCLLIFEDLDSIINDNQRSFFLNEVDGLESNDGICIIGSTNHLDRLDPAISKRPSRFDRQYYFESPNEEARTAYFMYWRQRLAGSSVNFPEQICRVASGMTQDFTYAYLQELMVTMMLANQYELDTKGGAVISEGDLTNHVTLLREQIEAPQQRKE